MEYCIEKLTIAIEFDGTIVEDQYPGIGSEKPLASAIIKALQAKGHQIILYTHRRGKELQAAVDWCAGRDLFFHHLNHNPFQKYSSRKTEADVYIDGKNLGGMPAWEEIFQVLHPYELSEINYRNKTNSDISS